jgi:hypothetical protein
MQRIIAAEQAPNSTGQQVYEGRVYSLDGESEPLFRYERRVKARGDQLTSTHLTYDPAGKAVVIQSATHTTTYELSDAELIQRQTGLAGAVRVSGNQVVFTLDHDGIVSTAHENVDSPVVAGASMFGYIVTHWDELRSGATLPIRFAVIERMETIGFLLDRVPSRPGRTTIRMRASSPLLRLIVAPTYFQFDTEQKRILEYTGRVPPMVKVANRLQPLDARVNYSFTAAVFQ